MDKIAKKLTEVEALEEQMGLRREHKRLPDEAQLKTLVRFVKMVVFPNFFNGTDDICSCIAGIEAILLKFAPREKVSAFVDKLPQIKHLLLTDVAAMAHNDPAVSSYDEIVMSYPAVKEMEYYRTAHALYEAGIDTLPRMITEIAHSETGIDIHPEAQIGEYFAIDHGTGIVVGQTCVIGKHVMLYQGVTLGAKNFRYDDKGNPVNLPRHPILEDNVTVYSNTSILGRVTIGHDTIIGGNIWLTHDVAPNSRIVQTKAVSEKGK